VNSQLHRHVGVALVLALAAGACKQDAAAPPAAVEVTVAAVVEKDVPVGSEWLGTTEGAIDAEIRAQVSGILLSREYGEGAQVKKDQVLFKIDPREYKAALESAKGDLSRARAVLGAADNDVRRYTPLAKSGAVSQRELDNAIQASAAGRASVEAAQAAVDKATLDLSFTDVRSPIDGIAGVALAQVGNLVSPGDPKPLTTVSQLDPIRVSFAISEQEYLRFADLFAEVSQHGPRPGDGRLDLVLTDGSTYKHKGKAVASGRAIDQATGTIPVKAEFANPGNVLRPGQYAKVRAVTETKKAALLVPQRSIREMQGVQQVGVVGDDDKVSMRVVTAGPTFESLRVIEKGVAKGERVIVEGLQKVREGMTVKPVSAAAPAEGE
jgi:membrane fusion protein (multidrug efflux system)